MVQSDLSSGLAGEGRLPYSCPDYRLGSLCGPAAVGVALRGKRGRALRESMFWAGILSLEDSVAGGSLPALRVSHPVRSFCLAVLGQHRGGGAHYRGLGPCAQALARGLDRWGLLRRHLGAGFGLGLVRLAVGGRSVQLPRLPALADLGRRGGWLGLATRQSLEPGHPMPGGGAGADRAGRFDLATGRRLA